MLSNTWIICIIKLSLNILITENQGVLTFSCGYTFDRTIYKMCIHNLFNQFHQKLYYSESFVSLSLYQGFCEMLAEI